MKRPKHWGTGKPDPEKVDPTPIELPAGFEKPPTLSEQIAQAVHWEMNQRGFEGFETPEEADDFEEDPDPDQLDMTPYEQMFEEPIFKDLEPDPPDRDTPPEPDPAEPAPPDEASRPDDADS